MVKVFTNFFDQHNTPIFKTFANVLNFSLKKNMPNAEFIMYEETNVELPNPNRVISDSAIHNTKKLDIWRDFINKCENGENVIIIDSDMIILEDISEVFNKDFDICYTRRSNTKTPINGGILFVKVSDKTKNFFNEYVKINYKMFIDENFHKIWREKYKGMNQAAFGYLLKNYSDKNLKFSNVPCEIYNACEPEWKNINTKKIKVLHLKGVMHKICSLYLQNKNYKYNFFNNKSNGKKNAFDLWEKYYKESGINYNDFVNKSEEKLKVAFTWFDSPDRYNFEKLKDVFIHSLLHHNNNIELIEIEKQYPNKIKDLPNAHFENIFKLGVWNDLIQKQETPLIICDCDLLVVNNIENIVNISTKDIIFTSRDKNNRFNGGFIYINPTPKAKEFFQEWYDISINSFDPKTNSMWKQYVSKYKGANQAVLGYLYENKKYADIIDEIPCHIWNCTDYEWEKFSPDTKIIHIKSELRDFVLNKNKTMRSHIKKDIVEHLAKKWFEYEADMIRSNPDKYKNEKINNRIERKVRPININKMTTVGQKTRKPRRIVKTAERVLQTKEKPTTLSNINENVNYIDGLKVHFTWFFSENRSNFERLRNVFVQSFKTHNPEIELIENLVPYPKKEKFAKTSSPSHFENIYKLWHWKEAVNKATSPILLIDSDIMFRQNISDILNQSNKDIVFTTRDKSYSDLKCNGGVILVKPTDKAKKFFEEWYRISVNEFDPRYNPMWAKLYQKYKGATQTTLGFLREQGSYEDIIGEIPCHIWNATPIEIDLIDEKTKIIHIKSQIRRSILSGVNLKNSKNQKMYEIAKEWFDYEKEYNKRKY